MGAQEHKPWVFRTRGTRTRKACRRPARRQKSVPFLFLSRHGYVSRAIVGPGHQRRPSEKRAHFVSLKGFVHEANLKKEAWMLWLCGRLYFCLPLHHDDRRKPNELGLASRIVYYTNNTLCVYCEGARIQITFGEKKLSVDYIFSHLSRPNPL